MTMYMEEEMKRTVTGDTFVYVKNSKLMNSVYAGGNGSTATVFQNTNLYIEGTTTEIRNSAFGGGKTSTNRRRRI